MIVLLLAALIGTAVTGHMMTTDAYMETRWVEKLHEALAHGTLILAGCTCWVLRSQACCTARIS